MSAIVPLRSGQLTFALHRCIIEKCFSTINKNPDLVKIFSKTKELGEGNVERAFEDIIGHINVPIDGKWEIHGIEESEGYKFLTQSRSKIGKLNDVNELVDSIRIVLQVISKKFFRVIIAIDELENLSRATSTERFLVSDFFRKVHESVEKDLTIFLIFTLDSYDDVPALLQRALLSRIKAQIEFSYIKSVDDVQEYIADCISKRCGVNSTEIIDPDVVKDIAESLIQAFKGNLSFRAINAEMHRIFSDIYFTAGDQAKIKIKITKELYSKARKKIVTEESVKKLAETLSRGAI